MIVRVLLVSMSHRLCASDSDAMKTLTSLLETYAQNTEILVRQKTMMLQEEKQRVNYLLSLFLPENQVFNDNSQLYYGITPIWPLSWPYHIGHIINLKS